MKKRKIKKRDSAGLILPDPAACERTKKRREKRRNTKKAKALRAKMPPRDSRTGVFLRSKNLTDEEILTKLLKQKMREIPERIPVSLMVVESRPNPTHQSWAGIIAEMICMKAAGYVVGKSDSVEFLKTLLDRVEGKVPETLRHGLDEFSPELIELVKDKMK